MGEAKSHGGGCGGDIIMGNHAYSYTTRNGDTGYGSSPKAAKDNASSKGNSNGRK